MDDNNHKCEYEYEEEGKECPHPYELTVEDPETGEEKHFCVFHAPEPKDKENFLKAFRELIQGYERGRFDKFDFEGFIFPKGPINFKEILGIKDVEFDFKNCVFEGAAVFDEFIFLRKAYFFNARFKRGAKFTETVFESDALFAGAKFEAGVDFFRSHFKGPADFVGVGFLSKQNDSIFARTMFEKEAAFISINSNSELIFSYTFFYSNALFMNASFKASVEFQSTNFLGKLDCQDAKVLQLDFMGAVFKTDPYFGNLSGSGKDIRISNFVAGGLIEFTGGYESDNSLGDPPISLEIIGGEYSGILSVRAPITGLKIRGATITGTLNVIPATGEETPEVDINSVNFVGVGLLRYITLENLKNTLVTGSLTVSDSDLSRTSFEGTTDLRNVDFINVKWPSINRRYFSKVRLLKSLPSALKKMNAIYDEIRFFGTPRPHDQSGGESVTPISEPRKRIRDVSERNFLLNTFGETYRAIATSYENRQRYGSAGPFKVGEFEARRRMRSVSCPEKIVLWFYRCFASYGESVLKPVGGLLITFLVPALIYFCTGVPELKREYALCENKGKIIYEETYRYETYRYWFVPSENESIVEGARFAEVGSNILNTLSLAWKGCMPVKTEQLDKITGWPSILSGLQRPLFIIFTALLLFALRRKTRR